MTTFSFYSFRIFKISPYINFKKFLGKILAPPSGRRPGADAPPPAPPRYATASCQHCDEQQFQTLSCALYTIFSVIKLDLVIQALLLDYILALGKKRLRIACTLFFYRNQYFKTFFK